MAVFKFCCTPHLPNYLIRKVTHNPELEKPKQRGRESVQGHVEATSAPRARVMNHVCRIPSHCVASQQYVIIIITLAITTYQKLYYVCHLILILIL